MALGDETVFDLKHDEWQYVGADLIDWTYTHGPEGEARFAMSESTSPASVAGREGVWVDKGNKWQSSNTAGHVFVKGTGRGIKMEGV